MRGGPGAVKVRGMAEITRARTHDARPWTEFVVAGKRVYVRTPRGLRLPRALRESGSEQGPAPPKIEARPVATEAEA
jgi:hypothetical protein